ncbi:MAG TPA: MarR family transcriptional regulator [Candidatus Saccharimonadales bacterium]
MNRKELLTQLEQAVIKLGRKMHEKSSGIFDISPAQKHVLMVLGDGGPTTIKQLSEKLSVTSGATTQHIDALEKLGFVSRIVNIDNRREVVVSITPHGWEEFKAMSKKKSETLSILFECLDDDELNSMVSLIEKVATNNEGAV